MAGVRRPRGRRRSGGSDAVAFGGLLRRRRCGQRPRLRRDRGRPGRRSRWVPAGRGERCQRGAGAGGGTRWRDRSGRALPAGRRGRGRRERDLGRRPVRQLRFPERTGLGAARGRRCRDRRAGLGRLWPRRLPSRRGRPRPRCTAGFEPGPPLCRPGQRRQRRGLRHSRYPHPRRGDLRADPRAGERCVAGVGPGVPRGLAEPH